MQNVNNNISFGSLYKYNQTSSNSSAVAEAEDIIYSKTGEEPELKYSNFDEITKTGIYAKSELYVDDKYDEFIESVLKQKNINFTKTTRKEALNHNNINNRIILPPETIDRGLQLCSINVEKLDKLLQKDKNFYISPQNKSNTKDYKYKHASEYISTGKEINASILVLDQDEESFIAGFIDGRHRYAIMRDMGMKNIKFAMSPDSIKLAKEYGLID